MTREEHGTALYTCPDCESVRIDRAPECECPEWEEVDTMPGVREPDLDTVLRTVFGMSPLGLEVCLCLMEVGPASVADVTEAVDADRSTVARHVDHLVDIGVLEPDERIRPEGGRVTVFRTAPPAVVRERFRRALYRWMGAAVGAVDDLTEEKVRSLAEVWTDRDGDAGPTAHDRSDGVYYGP